MPQLHNFTFFLPIFNEAHRLFHHRTALSFIQHAVIIDAGSTDESLNIIRGWDLPHVSIRSILNPDSKPRTPSWYQQVLECMTTKYFMMANAGHVYSVSLLRELDYICSDMRVDAISIPNHHFFCNELDSSFGSFLPSIAPCSISARFIHPSKPKSAALLHPDIIDWRKYCLHNELPICTNNELVWKSAKNPIFSFRDEDTRSIEFKNADYSTTHADHLMHLEPRLEISQFSMFITYFGHFFHAWLLKGSITQGVRGFITAHYWASYHTSVKIRFWEKQNQLDAKSIVAMHNMRKAILKDI